MATRRSTDTRQTVSPPSGAERGKGSTTAVSTSGTKRPARRRATSGTATGSAERAPPVVTSDARRAMIAEAAYLRAERRGFTPGFEEQDWLTAEQEVDALLSTRHSARQ
jgi:Protein of unknown function (DUF2934)